MSISPWFNAARPKTLPLAISGILVGSALAYVNHLFNFSILILGTITASLLQILSNYANDYGDFKKGTDTVANRKDRMLATGAITPKRMVVAMYIICILIVFLGVILLLQSGLKLDIIFIIFFFLGLVSIAAAIKYTVGKSAYAYTGFGDVFVFIFFGLVSVCGIFYLHTGLINTESILAGLGMGLLSVGVLNVNNMRDIISDELSGKMTLVVRFGLKKAAVYHLILCWAGLTFIILSFVHHMRTDFVQVMPVEYIMLIVVFAPIILSITGHMSRIKSFIGEPLHNKLSSNKEENRKNYNKELRTLSLITLAIAIIYWIVVLIYI